MGRISYVSEKDKVTPGSPRVAKVKCPKGRNAISGGVKSPNPFFNPSTEIKLTSTFGLGGRAWTGVIYNGSGASLKMRVWAICSAKNPDVSIMHNAPPGQPTNTQASLSTQPCEDDLAVTGIGAKFFTNPVGAEIASLRPIDMGDLGNLPDEGAQAYFNNQIGTDYQHSVVALCTDL